MDPQISSQSDQGQGESRLEANWAKPVISLDGEINRDGAINMNIKGRKVVGPLQGFGQLWQKTYRIRLSGIRVTPQQVVAVWKENLPTFMPATSRFYPSLTGVKPGEVIVINATLPGLPGGIPLSTGVLVIYSDEEMFTVMTPQGHPISGFNTFSAYEENGVVVAQVQGLIRANDPIYEFGFNFMGGFASEDKIWEYVLNSLAAYYGVKGYVQMNQIVLDPRRQWGQAKNIFYNSAIRTMVTSPLRWAGKLFHKPPRFY
jgi:hypothetical protein